MRVFVPNSEARASVRTSIVVFEDERSADLQTPSPGGAFVAARRRADALVLLAERALEAGVGQRPDEVRSGALAERYQVFVHAGTGTLRGEPAAGCG
jgi:hypothetical protein